MVLPIVDVVQPKDLSGQLNGRLDAGLLVPHLFAGYKQPASAHHTAMRAWSALDAGCFAATGVRLTITSLADAYRTYARQVTTFDGRYRQVGFLVYTITRPSRRKHCNSGYFVLVTGATAACPGTSNHGWGLAFDTALWILGAIQGITSNPHAWEWIKANAGLYGFSWELQSEPWHIRYVTGDRIPLAVLRYESGHNGGQPPVPPPSGGLIKSAPPAEPVPLRLGVQDPFRVRWLQQILNERFDGKLIVDGGFGALTEQRVKFMQHQLGIGADGVYGQQTATALAGWLAVH